MQDVGIALVLVAIAIVASRIERLELESELVIATVRALVQLLAIALVIKFVFSHAGLTGLLLVVMLGAAAFTSGRRLRGIPHATWVALGAIGIGAGIGFVILFGFNVFERDPRFIIPVTGMLIGNCMTAVSVAGARLRDELTDKTLEVEARLALGIRAREALRPYGRRGAITSLVPVIDATKNVGLILLPGAFVGMLLAGSSPLEAAQVQLIVLFMLIGAVSISAIATTYLVAREFIGDGERLVIPPAA